MKIMSISHSVLSAWYAFKFVSFTSVPALMQNKSEFNNFMGVENCRIKITKFFLDGWANRRCKLKDFF